MTSRRNVLIAGAGALLAPLNVRAQTSDRPARIGILNFGPPPAAGGPPEPIVRYLRSLNYVADTNVIFELRYANGDRDAYRALASELLRRNLDVLFMPGSNIAQTLKEVAPKIPVVFAVSDDPVASGVVQSLARPGGLVTGVTHMSPELAAKRLEILKEAVPNLRRVAMLYDPDQVVQYFQELQLAADRKRIRLIPGKFSSIADFDSVFAATTREGAQAMFVEPNRFTLAYAAQVARLAIKYRIAAISAYDTFVRNGGLLTYGATADDMIGRAAAQIDKILHGTKPADIPVEQPARFALIVNARAAAALGVTIPRPLLLRADEVIR
jgi:putative tryptophan/tyrosine transport system substrate-binding protein